VIRWARTRFRARHRWAGSLAVLLIAASVGLLWALLRSDRRALFAPHSIWNEPLSADPALDPRSAARVHALVSEVDAGIARHLWPAVQATSYGMPFYVVDDDAPLVRVHLDTGPWGDSLRRALKAGVPIPANARPASGTDRSLVVYRPSSDTMWELWQASRQADGWHAKWGGAMQHVSSNPGFYSSAAWPGLGPAQGWNWGVTATSLPAIAGVARVDELRAGQIDHALAVALPDTCARTFAWPAQRTDGSSESPDCIPGGAQLRLDPSVNVQRLRAGPLTRMIAVAAQRYGIVVRDTTGGSVAFVAEDPATAGREAWAGPNAVWGKGGDWALAGFPWHRLQVLAMTICVQAPCRRHHPQ
jgi:hypothetical protein